MGALRGLHQSVRWTVHKCNAPEAQRRENREIEEEPTEGKVCQAFTDCPKGTLEKQRTRVVLVDAYVSRWLWKI